MHRNRTAPALFRAGYQRLNFWHRIANIIGMLKIGFLVSIFVTSYCCAFAGTAPDSTVIRLWKGGAPGFEQLKDKPERAKNWWVRDINNPSLTVFLPPKGTANGTAIVLCPGGGFQNIVFDLEGSQPARFLNQYGITVFVLKYRLFNMSSSPYTLENAEQDIFRAMRLVKSKAKEFSIDTAKLGVMGFSAGGEAAAWVSYHFKQSHAASHDEIDLLSAKPAFQILIYPGPSTVPDSLPRDAPPAFLLAANGDPIGSPVIIRLLEMHRKARVPVEVHLYEKGEHGFHLAGDSAFTELKNWPQRLIDWLKDNGWVKK